MQSQTLLRVKRRRNAITALTLRVEGLEDYDDSDGDDILRRMSLSHDTENLKKAARVWKKVEQIPVNDRKRSIRVVNAILSDETQEEQSKKRQRRLTLLDTAKSPPSLLPKQCAKGYRIWNPLERLVDESLKSVHTGEITAVQHVNLITLDRRLLDQSRKWLTWCNEECGNILHQCALWNDVDMVSQLLSRSLEGFIDATDGEDRTPYEVAELAGHEQVCRILEAFGADASYVYDVYCLEESDSPASGDIACELQNGYWNERGDLVVENRTLLDNILQEKNETGGDEVDSNHEDWDGNDYPDDQAWGGSDDDDDEDEGINFRGHQMNLRQDDGSDFDAAYGICDQTDFDFDNET